MAAASRRAAQAGKSLLPSCCNAGMVGGEGRKLTKSPTKTNHVPHCHIQTVLERLQASTTSLGNLFQCVTTLYEWKNFLLIFNLNLPCPSLKPFPLVLSLPTLVNKIGRAHV